MTGIKVSLVVCVVHWVLYHIPMCLSEKKKPFIRNAGFLQYMLYRARGTKNKWAPRARDQIVIVPPTFSLRNRQLSFDSWLITHGKSRLVMSVKNTCIVVVLVVVINCRMCNNLNFIAWYWLLFFTYYNIYNSYVEYLQISWCVM